MGKIKLKSSNENALICLIFCSLKKNWKKKKRLSKRFGKKTIANKPFWKYVLGLPLEMVVVPLQLHWMLSWKLFFLVSQTLQVFLFCVFQKETTINKQSKGDKKMLLKCSSLMHRSTNLLFKPLKRSRSVAYFSTSSSETQTTTTSGERRRKFDINEVPSFKEILRSQQPSSSKTSSASTLDDLKDNDFPPYLPNDVTLGQGRNVFVETYGCQSKFFFYFYYFYYFCLFIYFFFY